MLAKSARQAQKHLKTADIPLTTLGEGVNDDTVNWYPSSLEKRPKKADSKDNQATLLLLFSAFLPPFLLKDAAISDFALQ